MKIAIPTNDRKTISEHFGRSKYFMIFEIDKGQIKSREERTNSERDHSHHSHGAIVKILEDCSDILCINLGMRIYNDLSSIGIKIHLVDEKNIEDAVKLFVEGKITDINDKKICLGGDYHEHN